MWWQHYPKLTIFVSMATSWRHDSGHANCTITISTILYTVLYYITHYAICNAMLCYTVYMLCCAIDTSVKVHKDWLNFSFKYMPPFIWVVYTFVQTPWIQHDNCHKTMYYINRQLTDQPWACGRFHSGPWK